MANPATRAKLRYDVEVASLGKGVFRAVVPEDDSKHIITAEIRDHEMSFNIDILREGITTNHVTGFVKLIEVNPDDAKSVSDLINRYFNPKTARRK